MVWCGLRCRAGSFGKELDWGEVEVEGNCQVVSRPTSLRCAQLIKATSMLDGPLPRGEGAEWKHFLSSHFNVPGSVLVCVNRTMRVCMRACYLWECSACMLNA